MRTLVILIVLAGCAELDPLTSPNAWHPTGANDANLRAMVADPRDLVAGAGNDVADGAVVAGAVARYRAGRVKQLPDASFVRIVPVASGTSAAPTTTAE